MDWETEFQECCGVPKAVRAALASANFGNES
jgi:hypothetical protein